MGISFFCINRLKQYNPTNPKITNKIIAPITIKIIAATEIPFGSSSTSLKLPSRNTGVLLTLIVSLPDIFFSF